LVWMWISHSLSGRPLRLLFSFSQLHVIRTWWYS
jgi:hypothetical protein